MQNLTSASDIWKLRKLFHHQENAFPHPPEMPEPEKVILRPTDWNSGFLGSGSLWSPVPGPFLCLQRGLAIAGVFSSCRSAPSFLFDVCTFQPWVLFIGHDAVRIYKRELPEKSWNGASCALATSITNRLRGSLPSGIRMLCWVERDRPREFLSSQAQSSHVTWVLCTYIFLFLESLSIFLLPKDELLRVSQDWLIPNTISFSFSAFPEPLYFFHKSLHGLKIFVGEWTIGIRSSELKSWICVTFGGSFDLWSPRFSHLFERSGSKVPQVLGF